MNSLDKPALTFDEMLDQGSPHTELVPLCLNGELVRQYEEVLARIAVRAEARDAEREAAVKAAAADDRLGVPEPEPVEETPDPDQAEVDRLLAEMKRFTTVFKIVSIGEKYNELLEKHPPRLDANDAKRLDPRDSRGYNSATFPRALVRESIAEPEMTDARWEKLMRGRSRISDAQVDRLWTAALLVNRSDADLPFSHADLGEARR